MLMYQLVRPHFQPKELCNTLHPEPPPFFCTNYSDVAASCNVGSSSSVPSFMIYFSVPIITVTLTFPYLSISARTPYPQITSFLRTPTSAPTVDLAHISLGLLIPDQSMHVISLPPWIPSMSPSTFPSNFPLPLHIF